MNTEASWPEKIANAPAKRQFQREVTQLLRGAKVPCVQRHNWLVQRLYMREAARRSIAFVGAMEEKHFDLARTSLDHYRVVSELNNEFVRALWFENGECGLLFSPKPKFCSLDQRTFNASTENQIALELKGMARNLGIKRLMDADYADCRAIHGAFNEYIQRQQGISFFAAGDLRHYNSQKEVERCYRDYCNNVFPEHYGHAECFGRVYFWSVKLMAEIFGRGNQPISVHDVATNTGHLPLLLARLKSDELMGLQIGRIIASDLNLAAPRYLIGKVLRKERMSSGRIKVIRVNLLGGIERMPLTDVIVANDVLEHFPEETSLTILKSLWARTQKLLMVHVPVEEVPDPTYGHLTSFNGEKIRKWASYLPGGTFVSDRYHEYANMPLSNFGYLAMVKGQA